MVDLMTESQARCMLKHRYVTKKSALGSISRQRKVNNIELRYYKCPHCKNYHLTKQEQNTFHL